MMSAIFALLLLTAVISVDAEPWNDEQRLVHDLFEAGRYDATTRPTRNVSQATNVTLQVQVFGILGLEAPQGRGGFSRPYVVTGMEGRYVDEHPEDPLGRGEFIRPHPVNGMERRYRDEPPDNLAGRVVRNPFVY